MIRWIDCHVCVKTLHRRFTRSCTQSVRVWIEP